MTAKSFTIYLVQRAATAVTDASESEDGMAHLVHQGSQDILDTPHFVDGGPYDVDPLGRSPIGHFRLLESTNLVLMPSTRTFIDPLDTTPVPECSQKQKIIQHEESVFEVKFSVTPRFVEQLLM